MWHVGNLFKLKAARSFIPLSFASIATITTWLQEVVIQVSRQSIDIDGKLRVWALDNEEHPLKKEVRLRLCLECFSDCIGRSGDS